MEERRLQSVRFYTEMTFLTIILFFVSVALSLPVLVICKHQKTKQIYKPGHIPEFENPENEETDTYYGLNSSRLFPDREKGRVNKSAALDEKNTALSLPVLVICKHQKTKQIYKPGHIPEFENPENEETDTYYGLNSSRLFPDREKGRVNKSSALDEKKSEGINVGVEGIGVSDTQPTKDQSYK
ncbi:unnamed protein product [Strongylus vulgaris]|uniref:Uncharacterized protein n=1 Tax=Strongylus vulgaris TaxID=40348 RepID=A0A3P7LRW9_STRVU|nr:unnamed protein product [Strongylus vulgaris]